MCRLVICINNKSNPASLILGKVYRALPDAEAEARNMLRVVYEDTSEPDGYLYPASMFAPTELPEVPKSPLDVHGVNTSATTEDILEAVRESRAR